MPDNGSRPNHVLYGSDVELSVEVDRHRHPPSRAIRHNLSRIEKNPPTKGGFFRGDSQRGSALVVQSCLGRGQTGNGHPER